MKINPAVKIGLTVRGTAIEEKGGRSVAEALRHRLRLKKKRSRGV